MVTHASFALRYFKCVWQRTSLEGLKISRNVCWIISRVSGKPFSIEFLLLWLHFFKAPLTTPFLFLNHTQMLGGFLYGRTQRVRSMRSKRSRQNISRIEKSVTKNRIFFLFCQNIPFCESVSKKNILKFQRFFSGSNLKQVANSLKKPFSPCLNGQIVTRL